MRYKRAGHNVKVMRQIAYLAINPVMFNEVLCSLLDCRSADRNSDLMKAPTLECLIKLIGTRCVLALGSGGRFLLLQCFNVSFAAKSSLLFHLSDDA